MSKFLSFLILKYLCLTQTTQLSTIEQSTAIADGEFICTSSHCLNFEISVSICLQISSKHILGQIILGPGYTLLHMTTGGKKSGFAKCCNILVMSQKTVMF